METQSAPGARPLEGVNVLDLTIALAGPFATLLLAGLGARVVKVENPAGGDPCRSNPPYLGPEGASLTRQHAADLSVSALSRLRNKLGVTLNLKHADARSIMADLVRSSDVVVENFSRGTLDRLGVGYAFAREINPRIVFCSITGFGTDADATGGKAMDTIVQALSGVMLTSGLPGEPPVRVGVPFGDLVAPLFGVIGIQAALRQAERSGVGQHVDVSMLGALTAMVAAEPFDILERCGVPQRTGQTVPRLAPFGVYPTSDGYIAICAPTEVFARSLFSVMGRPELEHDARFTTRDRRVVNVQALDAMVAEFTRSLPTAEVAARLEQAGVPAAEVRDPSAGVRDPRLVARGETVPIPHPEFGAVGEVMGMGMPIRFSESTAGFDRPAPRLGEHNQFVYGELLGYPPQKIQDLEARHVI